MKSISQSRTIQQLASFVRKPVFLLGACFAVIGAQAQTAVTGINYGTVVDNANQTTGGITYLNRDRPVNTVTTVIPVPSRVVGSGQVTGQGAVAP